MTPSRFSGQDMSLAELRTLPDIGVERVYVTDLGKQGWFEIDPMDTTSADNTGTVVVNSTLMDGSAPTHSSGSTGNWSYVSAQAALTAL